MFASLCAVATSTARAADAATTARCTAYATQAVEDYRLLSTHPACRAGALNPAFNANYQLHFNGCVFYPAAVAESAQRFRTDFLQKCGASPRPSADGTPPNSVPAGSGPAPTDPGKMPVGKPDAPPQAAASAPAQQPLSASASQPANPPGVSSAEPTLQQFNTLIRQAQELNPDAGESLTDLRDVVYAFAHYDDTAEMTAVQSALSRAAAHLQQKLGSVDFRDPALTGAQKTAIADALRAATDASTATSEAARAVGLKLLIARYTRVARGELAFTSEQLVLAYSQATQSADKDKGAELKRRIGIVQAATFSNTTQMYTGVAALRDRTAQRELPLMRARVEKDWDLIIEHTAENYRYVTLRTAYEARLKSAAALPPARGPFKNSPDPRYITATVRGRVDRGSDPEDLFHVGGDLSGLPFVLQVRFTDTKGGELGSTCGAPYGVASSTPKDIPVKATLTIGVQPYVFGRDEPASGATDRVVQGSNPRLRALFVRASEGPTDTGQSMPNYMTSTAPIQLTLQSTGPEASCDWRGSVALVVSEAASAGVILRETGPAGHNGGANLLPESASVEGLPTLAKVIAKAPGKASIPTNPIIGVWVDKVSGAVQLTPIEFTPTEDISAGVHLKVKYVVAGDTVVIIPEGAVPRTCKVDGDEMSCQTSAGVLQYVRLRR